MKFLFLLLFLTSAFAQEPAPEVPASFPAPVSHTAFSKILILSEVNLLGFSWKDLGLERESQFTAPLLKSWEKWLKEHTPKNVGEAKICEADCLTYHAQWEEKLPEELAAVTDTEYANVLWLKVSITLRRNLKNNIQGFSWDGRVHLLDGNTKRAVANLTLPREQKEWVNLPQADINTKLVTRVYKTGLGSFPGLSEKIEKALPLNRVIRLTITGYKHMGDVTKLVELLQSRGSFLGLEAEMSGFGSGEAVMKVFFRGEEKSFTDLLSQVKELKSSYNYSLVNEVTGTGHVIRMVKQ